MAKSLRILRVCANGHRYYKSSSCPVCPVCESEKKPDADFLSKLSAPARRALENEGITTLRNLSIKRKEDILKLHGMGPSSIPKLEAALKLQGLSFKE